MRKTALCICENKGADQLRSDCEAGQCLSVRYIDSTIPLLPESENFKTLTSFCSCTAWIVSDLVGNPEDRFSHDGLKFILENKDL